MDANNLSAGRQGVRGFYAGDGEGVLVALVYPGPACLRWTLIKISAGDGSEGATT